jgi:hypothetical protein
MVMVKQCSELLLLPFLCCFPHTTQSLGHAPPRRVGRVCDCLVFSLVSGLPSPLSADGLPSLFEPFIGTTPLSDSSETCVRVLWLVAFSRRPVATAAPGVSEVSRFSCMKFLSVSGVYDAEPDGCSRFRSPPCCAFRIHAQRRHSEEYFRSSIPSPPIPCLRFAVGLTTNDAKLGARMDRLLLSGETLSFSTSCRFNPAHP